MNIYINTYNVNEARKRAQRAIACSNISNYFFESIGEVITRAKVFSHVSEPESYPSHKLLARATVYTVYDLYTLKLKQQFLVDLYYWDYYSREWKSPSDALGDRITKVLLPLVPLLK